VYNIFLLHLLRVDLTLFTQTPLPLEGCACNNKNVTLNIVQLLIHAAPNSVRMDDNDGWMPLHYICDNKEQVDETTSVDILKLLLEKNPEAVRHEDDFFSLPLHHAARAKSPEFCRVLIEAYHGPEQIADPHGALTLDYPCGEYGRLPLHHACWDNTVATVEYLYKLYPNAINDATTDGEYPIHDAIGGLDDRDNPAAAVDVVKFLLDCDPKVILQKFQGTTSLLHYSCLMEYNDSNIEAGIQVIKVIYDAHPEAIEDKELASEIHRYHQDVQTFINSQLFYSLQAKDHCLMTTPDESGQLPLHRALQKNVTLGSITLLVQGNPSAIRSFDKDGVTPLHIACAHHESASVVQYLLGLHTSKRTLRAADFALGAVDRDGNTALHYACRGAKYETIALLLDMYDAAPVSKRNDDKKLPIELLWESDRVEDRESIEYMESIFRLLRAYPEPIVNYNAKQQAKKKRKFDHGNETGESADECSSRSSVGY
jgi:ankyrin repeat protein